MLFVPRISEFYGIVVAMYYREHGAPHFHATYAGETVVVAIQSGDVIAGTVPARAFAVSPRVVCAASRRVAAQLAPSTGERTAGAHRSAPLAS